MRPGGDTGARDRGCIRVGRLVLGTSPKGLRTAAATGTGRRRGRPRPLRRREREVGDARLRERGRRAVQRRGVIHGDDDAGFVHQVDALDVQLDLGEGDPLPGCGDRGARRRARCEARYVVCTVRLVAVGAVPSPEEVRGDARAPEGALDVDVVSRDDWSLGGQRGADAAVARGRRRRALTRRVDAFERDRVSHDGHTGRRHSVRGVRAGRVCVDAPRAVSLPLSFWHAAVRLRFIFLAGAVSVAEGTSLAEPMSSHISGSSRATSVISTHAPP